MKRIFNWLTTAPNRAYLATVLRTFVQIPLQGTSDTFGTLYKMPVLRLKGDEYGG
mgnify:CR=1 FL=1